MMTEPIVLTVPEKIANLAREIAETTNQPVEDVLIDQLKKLSPPVPVLPPDEQAELEVLHHLSDDTLWTIAREQMPEDVQARAHELMDKNSVDTITDEEYAELEQLVERADRLMLRKAKASAILQNRGYSFTQNDFLPKHG